MNEAHQASRWSHVARGASRCSLLVMAVVLAWAPGKEPVAQVVVPAISPFIALGSTVSVRAVGLVTLLSLPVLLLVLCFPRWFCRYGCPVGLLQEIVEMTRPDAPKRWLRWPRVGPSLVLLTFGGAVMGYPFFLWLDPLAFLNGFLNAWHQPFSLAALLAGAGLPLVLALDVAAPRFWCQRVCPLGATQDLLALPRRWFRAWSRSAEESDRASGGGGTRWGRRWFLVATGGAVGAAVLRVARGQATPPLRPPGSLEEHQFTGVCVRCGNCAKVCPADIIRPDLGGSGAAGFLAPRLHFDRDYCREACNRCNEVCPSGAIGRLPLAGKQQYRIGEARVDLDVCLLAQGRECTACIRKCPYHAIGMLSVDGGFSNEPRVNLPRCNGCGACEAVCPTQPVRAIRVHPLPPPRRSA